MVAGRAYIGSAPIGKLAHRGRPGAMRGQVNDGKPGQRHRRRGHLIVSRAANKLPHATGSARPAPFPTSVGRHSMTMAAGWAQEGGPHGEAERFGGLEVDDQLEIVGCITGRSAGFSPLRIL